VSEAERKSPFKAIFATNTYEGVVFIETLTSILEFSKFLFLRPVFRHQPYPITMAATLKSKGRR